MNRSQVVAAAAAVVAGAAVLAAAAVIVAHVGGVPDHLDLVVLAAVLAASMQLEVDLPDGGEIPVAPAVVVGLAAVLAPASAAVVVGLGLVAGFGLLAVRTSGPHGRFEGAWLLLVASAAIASHAVVAVALRALPVRGDAAILLQAGVAAVFVTALSRVVREPRAARNLRFGVDRRVDMALLCAAALLALAEHHQGLSGVLVAAVPVLVIRFSFGRYAAARRTYTQAVQALGVVPEVAGLAALGHGERTAAYARDLATALGLTPVQIDEIVTAARLHHIGTVAHDRAQVLHRGPDREVGEAAAEILQETGFLAPVAELVQATAAHDRGHTDVRVAVIRVASSVDEICNARQPVPPHTTTLGGSREVDEILLLRHPSGTEYEVARVMLELLDSRGQSAAPGPAEPVVAGPATTRRDRIRGAAHGQKRPVRGLRSGSRSGEA